ncbi:hypothetical protein MWLf4_2140 [Limosilactobacillus fermentum]|nr:hypothetical protein MWLf4_2140 [Limosilactobacillus fermentum]
MRPEIVSIHIHVAAKPRLPNENATYFSTEKRVAFLYC